MRWLLAPLGLLAASGCAHHTAEMRFSSTPAPVVLGARDAIREDAFVPGTHVVVSQMYERVGEGSGCYKIGSAMVCSSWARSTSLLDEAAARHLTGRRLASIQNLRIEANTRAGPMGGSAVVHVYGDVVEILPPEHWRPEVFLQRALELKSATRLAEAELALNHIQASYPGSPEAVLAAGALVQTRQQMAESEVRARTRRMERRGIVIGVGGGAGVVGTGESLARSGSLMWGWAFGPVTAYMGGGGGSVSKPEAVGGDVQMQHQFLGLQGYLLRGAYVKAAAGAANSRYADDEADQTRRKGWGLQVAGGYEQRLASWFAVAGEAGMAYSHTGLHTGSTWGVTANALFYVWSP